MSKVVTDEVQESQVGKLPVPMLAVCMVDFDRVFHGEAQPALCASSALMLEEFPSGCLQPALFPSSRAPVAPVAVIRTHSFA